MNVEIKSFLQKINPVYTFFSVSYSQCIYADVEEINQTRTVFSSRSQIPAGV